MLAPLLKKIVSFLGASSGRRNKGKKKKKSERTNTSEPAENGMFLWLIEGPRNMDLITKDERNRRNGRLGAAAGKDNAKYGGAIQGRKGLPYTKYGASGGVQGKGFGGLGEKMSLTAGPLAM